MPTTPTNNTRVNPNDGLLDVFHPDTNAWVRAIALLQLSSGLGISLIPDQAAQLQQIATNSGKLNNLLTEFQSMDPVIAAIRTDLDNLYVLLQGQVNPGITGVNTHLTNLETNTTNVFNKAEAVRSLLNDTIAATLSTIAGKVVDYSTVLANMNGTLSAIRTATVDIDALTTAIVNGTLPKVPVVYTMNLNAADTEFSRTLPNKLKTLSFKCRKDSSGKSYDLRYAFTTNQVANPNTGTYRTLDAFNEYSERIGGADSLVLYAASSAATANAPLTVEVEAWS